MIVIIRWRREINYYYIEGEVPSGIENFNFFFVCLEKARELDKKENERGRDRERQLWAEKSERFCWTWTQSVWSGCTMVFLANVFDSHPSEYLILWCQQKSFRTERNIWLTSHEMTCWLSLTTHLLFLQTDCNRHATGKRHHPESTGSRGNGLIATGSDSAGTSAGESWRSRPMV